MASVEQKLPKFPFVSLYLIKGRHRITYTLGGQRITERLGIDPGKAAKRARFVSDLLDSLKSRLIDLDSVRRQISDHRHISVFVEQFRQALLAKNDKPGHVEKTIYRLNHMIDLMSASRLQHITSVAAARAIRTLRAETRKDGRGRPTDKPLTAQTISYYQRTLKQFTRWLAGSDKKYFTVDPLAQMDSIPIKGTGKVRRILSDAEFSRLIDWLWDQPRRRRRESPAGLERALIYATAYSTGLRAGEIRSVDVRWVSMEAPPSINVPAEFTKNRQAAIQPIPRWLATALKAWIGDRVSGKLFPRMPVSPARMLASDLADCREAWIGQASGEEISRRRESSFLLRVTAAGQIDFHSLRHGFVSRLIDQGVNAKQAQALARHSTPALTLGTYSHTDAMSTAQRVDQAMPNLESERMREALRLSGVVSTKNDPKSGTSAQEAADNKRRKSLRDKADLK